MVKIPETLAFLLKNDLDGEIEISEDRANWEYIYDVGRLIDKDMIMIHFEKALTVYKGAYQAVNRIFLENLGEPCKYVNREQDLGLPGLRKAKSKYHPVWFVKKYNFKILN